MVVNKRKKSGRFRAHTTHGYGSMKKNRGAGHRGGKGMAGSGKRADQKKTRILVEFGNAYFGKKGFSRPQQMIVKHNALNLGDLEKYLGDKTLVAKEGDSFVVDLKKLGFDKLLGKGQLRAKIKLISPSVSKIAKKKIEDAGGEIIGDSTSE